MSILADGYPEDLREEILRLETENARLRALLQKCVIWIQDECQPEAEFVAEGHNLSMSVDDRHR